MFDHFSILGMKGLKNILQSMIIQRKSHKYQNIISKCEEKLLQSMAVITR